MASRFRYAVNRSTRQFARFFAGDERIDVPLPAAWEEVPSEQFARSCPAGFTAVAPPEGQTWFHPDRPPRAPGGWRSRFTVAGIAALALVAVGFALFGYAQASGVHCPQCDRDSLGDRYEAWVTLFEAKDAVLLVGVSLALVSVPFAKRRMWSVAALGLGFLLLSFKPL